MSFGIQDSRSARKRFVASIVASYLTLLSSGCSPTSLRSLKVGDLDLMLHEVFPNKSQCH
jgi:hypothetical protein